ncbi:MAG: hypothetical protein AUI00_05660 [Verrucomicrobia bacterium 13_2_20CM_2_54_15]|nr:MAG: hypothetical protein AUI00_05660 [Verrucomicrobia bacterium 13_2_20CM_2_54_15]
MRRLGGISISRYQLIRDVSAPLDMTTKVKTAILTVFLAYAALAQESQTPTSSAMPEESPSLSPVPIESLTPTPASEQTPSPSPARSIRISFVPPPLEGRISLGIYDAQGKLLRVLHHEADLNEFKIGADSLVTQWDGKNDNGEDLPAGRYHARGYLVGSLKVEDLNQAAASPPENKSNASVKMTLMPNPLANDKRTLVELATGFDNDRSYLKTNDGLRLFTISESRNLSRVSIIRKGDKSVDVWQTDGTVFHQFRISNVDQMMAFDCGEFELK